MLPEEIHTWLETFRSVFSEYDIDQWAKTLDTWFELNRAFRVFPIVSEHGSIAVRGYLEHLATLCSRHPLPSQSTIEGLASDLKLAFQNLEREVQDPQLWRQISLASNPKTERTLFPSRLE